MKTLFVEKNINYSGKELSPHYIFTNFGLKGDALVSFIGKADVGRDYMVDLEDVGKSEFIYSPVMLHFLGEFFRFSLFETVCLQRLLAALTGEILRDEFGVVNRRHGDDLFIAEEGKLSVSIATVSPVSSLLHFGVNIETQGTPVNAAGLSDHGVDPEELASRILKNFSNEVEDMKLSLAKVRPVYGEVFHD